MFKRKHVLLVMLMIAMLAMGGLATAQEPYTVQIFVGLGTGTSPLQIPPQEALAERFNAEHDDLQIEFLIVPNDVSQDRLTTMIAGGNPPDLVGPNGVSTIALFLDNWLDITPFIEAENFDTSDFYPTSLEINKYEDINTGLPLGLFPSYIYYNVDLFDAAGIEYPPSSYDDESWTYEALQDAAMQLTLDGNGNDATSPDFDADDIVQWGFDDSWISARGKLVGWGAPGVGRPASEDFKTAEANSPEWVAGMQWYADGIWTNHFIPGPDGLSAMEAAGIGTPLDGGLLGMFHSHTWYLPEMGYSELVFDVQVAPVPFNPNGTRVARIHADNFTIPADAANPEASWEVMKWLAHPDQIIDVCLIYGCIPASQSVADDFRAALEENFPGLDFDVVFESINHLDAPNHESWTPQWGRVEDTMEFAFGRVLAGETLDAQIVLDEANAEIQGFLDEYWASQ